MAPLACCASERPTVPPQSWHWMVSRSTGVKYNLVSRSDRHPGDPAAENLSPEKQETSRALGRATSAASRAGPMGPRSRQAGGRGEEALEGKGRHGGQCFPSSSTSPCSAGQDSSVFI